MAKPEWGAKRTCQSCGTRFYDLMRSPITCPKCGSAVEPEAMFKPRRQPVAVVEPKVEPVVLDDDLGDIEIDESGEELEIAEEEEDTDIVAGEEDDESGLIEDASDLGEDDDDMAEVMEHLDEDLDNEL